VVPVTSGEEVKDEVFPSSKGFSIEMLRMDYGKKVFLPG
jgi:hypothetical protein